MKKALLFVAATVVSASAFASIGVSVRSDYINTMKGKDSADADVDGSSLFTPSYARMIWGAKVGEADVVANFDLLDTTAPATSINHLYIKKTFADGWAMSVGKLVDLTGGFEAQAIDAGDDYWASLANGKGAINAGANTINAVQSLANSSGVGLHWGSGSHGVEVQATNDSNSAAPNNSHNWGLAYTGGLSESLWLKAHYVNGFTDAAATDTDQKYMGVGVKWAAAPFDLTFDYLMNSSKATASGSKEVKTTTMVANLKYSMDNMMPFLKVESSTQKDEVQANEAGDLTRMAFTVGLEVAQGSDFRYHVAYTSAADTYKAAAPNDNKGQTSQLLAGIKWNADLLK